MGFNPPPGGGGFVGGDSMLMMDDLPMADGTMDHNFINGPDVGGDFMYLPPDVTPEFDFVNECEFCNRIIESGNTRLIINVVNQ